MDPRLGGVAHFAEAVNESGTESVPRHRQKDAQEAEFSVESIVSHQADRTWKS